MCIKLIEHNRWKETAEQAAAGAAEFPGITPTQGNISVRLRQSILCKNKIWDYYIMLLRLHSSQKVNSKNLKLPQTSSLPFTQFIGAPPTQVMQNFC